MGSAGVGLSGAVGAVGLRGSGCTADDACGGTGFPVTAGRGRAAGSGRRGAMKAAAVCELMAGGSSGRTGVVGFPISWRRGGRTNGLVGALDGVAGVRGFELGAGITGTRSE